MKTYFPQILFFILSIAFISCNKSISNDVMSQKKYNNLTDDEKAILLHKGTERAFSGEYDGFYEAGVYLCKQCNSPLFKSDSKFKSGSGWPSFDDMIENAVKPIADADGVRTEIVCAECGGHLGHVFYGEGFTPKNTRHCVNSISLKFVPEDDTANFEIAIFASGCFWGTQYYMQKAEGVVNTQVGYIGGEVNNPTYEQVCSGNTGHAEAVKVVFDTSKTSYEELTKLFFETHDQSQVNRQGPDIGEQYRSEIFYENENQKIIAQKLVSLLESKNFKVATKITKASQFWVAEDYHQNYYTRKNGIPYCHFFVKKFE